MPVSEAQKLAAGEVVVALSAAYAPGRGRRRLATIFMELVDKEAWPEYYEVCNNDSRSNANVALMFSPEVIPEPRCINGIQERIASNDYKDSLEIYEDLSLVFRNAMYYNEDGSQIWRDAATLKVCASLSAFDPFWIDNGYAGRPLS